MADVLSQSQIDALLNAVRKGERALDQSADSLQAEKWRKYDFSSPQKFTKDRIKMLNGIFDNYSRVIRSRINARLRTNCEISVETIEEQRFYEFSNILTEGDVLGLVNVIYKGELQELPLLFYLSTTTALSMMDRMMGGEGVQELDVGSEYSYTEVELQLYEDLARDMVSVMDTSWENYIPLKFEYEKTDVNPTLSQTIGVDETVIIINMRIQFPEQEGAMSICLPGEMLTNIFAEVSRDKPGHRAQAEDKSEEIFDQLRDSNLEIVAELGEARLSLRDVFHLSVGDVIDLGKSKDAPVYLGIGGYHWFTGRIGTHKKSMAVKIDEVCYQTEQRSE